MDNKKIIIGMSGGVDSSVCAYLLKKQNYDVIGLFMHNWDNYTNNDILGQTNSNSCDLAKDFSDVEAICNKINIPCYKVNFIKQYWDNVFKYVIDEYSKGNTPNPDVLCNKYIKFGEFINYCEKEFNTSKIAMGHYANTKIIKGIKYLTMAKDKNKDQTYFLCWLTQSQLDKCIFPIGNIKKTKVRKIAKENNLITWNKKDSTGICFIGERKFNEFLKNYLKPKSGKIIDIETNIELGNHEGQMFYTIGQNKNLKLSGMKKKYFVCKKDIEKNIIYVVDEKNKDIYLSSNSCVLLNFNWINTSVWRKQNIKIRFRHRQKLVKGKFTIVNNQITLKYKKTLSVTPGQFAVLYYKKICLGGGVVDHTTNI